MLLLDSNTARQPSDKFGVFCRRHATIRSTSGIAEPHSRHTSGVHAICCSQVPRYSCDHAAVATIEIAQVKTIRCIRLFQDQSGWTPHYVEGGVHERYSPVCLGPAYLKTVEFQQVVKV